VPPARVDHTEVERDRGRREQDTPEDHAFHRFASQIAIAGEKIHTQFMSRSSIRPSFPAS
jgi:hypothetical protein